MSNQEQEAVHQEFCNIADAHFGKSPEVWHTPRPSDGVMVKVCEAYPVSKERVDFLEAHSNHLDGVIAEQREIIAARDGEIEQHKESIAGQNRIIAAQVDKIVRLNIQPGILYDKECEIQQWREKSADQDFEIERLEAELARLKAQPQGAGARFAVGERVQVKDSVSGCLGTVEQVLPDGKTYKVEWDHGMTLTYDESDLSPAAPKPREGAEVPVAKPNVVTDVDFEAVVRKILVEYALTFSALAKAKAETTE